MKFLYSDTQDYVDPNYDFIADRSHPTRERYWSDVYAHEIMNPTPYDGLLIAMSAVRQAEGIAKSKVRYSTKEEQRLLRDGARKFLRFDGNKYKDKMVMGDCGSFAYVDMPAPPFSPEEVDEFYRDCQFSHGVSPDHIIFDCNLDNPSRSSVSIETLNRYELTLTNAQRFLEIANKNNAKYTPLGAVQGWSPKSMAESALTLQEMGYKYLAIGGLVPLKVDVIKIVLEEIRKVISPLTEIHLLGFAKAQTIHEFTGYGITSFDSTSPMIRAFKDEKDNYYAPSQAGRLEYFTAIRIPQAIENPRLLQGIKKGQFSAEDLCAKEKKALNALRDFDKGIGEMDGALNAIMEYHQFLLRGSNDSIESQDKSLEKTRKHVKRTLENMPWKACRCDICMDIGVEAIIFRSSNRNKRRGFHNLGVYHQYLQKVIGNI